MRKPLVQGDVMLLPINTMPTNGTDAKTKILAYGETSGHRHELFGECDVVESDGAMYVNAKGVLMLEHVKGDRTLADHNVIEVPQGLYRVVIQREYDPYERIVNRVQD